ncbi:50S ribosomal protein L3 [Candidatus Daviesbacteria bacterium]|nr:50S ribosomal protein L3 [Candidatus Daviesbacteria bacterium]
MINTLLGIKKGMTSTYDTRGRRVGATVVEVSPNFVTQIKTSDSKDGYEAVQIGMGSKKSVKKPQLGHFKKTGIDGRLAHLKEVRIKPMRSASSKNLASQVTSNLEGLQLGQQIQIGQVFFVGDAVKVSGVSKGRGFAGGIKRHGFHGGPKTHGQSDRHRAPGSIGSGTTPGRVLKGKKMAGHMGVANVSYTGLEVVGVDRTSNLLTIKGGIPGPVGSLVIVEKQGRIRGYTPPPEEKEEEGEEKAETKGAGEEVKEGETKEEVKSPESEEGANAEEAKGE